MHSTKYLIIGNSTAAIGAVEGIRKQDCDGKITVVSKEKYHTYSRPLISYLLAGYVNEERMYYRNKDFYTKNNVESILGVAATDVNSTDKTVTLADGQIIRFEKLILATGGKPFIPPLEGAGANGVFTFTEWDDVTKIEDYITGTDAKNALVIGGGLIGIKAAEALRERGLNVTMLELQDRVLPLALDATAAEMAKVALEDAGVNLKCGVTADELVTSGGFVTGAKLTDGTQIDCKIVVLAIGVTPETTLAKSAGVDIAKGVLINEHCQTSNSDIYAAGDISEGLDTLLDTARPIPIFPNAYRQGSVAGVHAAGGSEVMENAFAMNSVEFFSLPSISVGLATAEGESYEVYTKHDKKANTYRRIVIEDNRLVGVMLLGNIDRAGIYTGLIRSGVDISEIKDNLIRNEVGLITLPSDYRKHIVTGEGMLI